MSGDERHRGKFNNFASKYRLWLLIPLVFCALTASRDPTTGLTLLFFFAGIFIVSLLVRKVISVSSKLIPKHVSADQRKALVEAGSATLFLGGLAITGVILEGENFASNWVAEYLPETTSLGFIDPTSTFAAIVLVGLWLFTFYRIKR